MTAPDLHPELHQAHDLLSHFLACVTAGQAQVSDAQLSHLHIAASALQAALTHARHSPSSTGPAST